MSSSELFPQFIDVAQAGFDLEQIIRRASGEDAERFMIGQGEGPKVVVMGLVDYLKMTVPVHPVVAKMHALSEAAGTDKMTMDEIDAEIAACREEERMAHADSLCRS
jgi:hypothetical protein